MSIDLLFTVSALYSAIIGLAALLDPALFMGSHPPVDPAMADIFRGFGGLMVAVAVLDWMARGTAASRARNAIVLSNTIGFLFATIFSGLAVLLGYPSWAWALVALNALLTVGYFLAALRRTPVEEALAPGVPTPIATRVPSALAAKELGEGNPAEPIAGPIPRRTGGKTARKPAGRASRKNTRRV